MINPTRIAEDAQGKRITYDEIEIGRDLGVLEWTISPEDIEYQCLIDEDFHPWFKNASPWGERVAPPQIQYRPPRWLLSRNYNVRGVFFRWEFEHKAPLHAGVKILVSGRILDKWIEREREYVKFEAIGRDLAGVELFRTVRVHVLDVIKRTAPRGGKGLDSGIKAERL
jgi:hypothetical protein